MELKIEYIPTADLVPYAGNAKLHPDEQIAQIAESIEKFGFNDPIALWKGNEIIEGHGRLLAAVQIGMETVPVIRLDDLTDAQRKAYGLVHNQLTMNTGFDISKLNLELESLTLDFDMSAFGFKQPEEAEPIDLDGYGEGAGSKTGEECTCPKCGFVFLKEK